MVGKKRRIVISDDESSDDDTSDQDQDAPMAVDVEWRRVMGKPGWWRGPLRLKEEGPVQLELICGACKTVEKLFNRSPESATG